MMKRHLLFGSLAVVCGVVATGQFFLSNEGVYTPRNENQEIAAEEVAGSIEYLNRLRANPETGLVDPMDVIRARKAVNAMPVNKALDLEWMELGPDNVGGRTRAILIDRNNPSRVYAGGVAGGVWISNNGGQSWSRQDNNGVDMNLAVVSMAQSANGDIYVGTGEGMYYSASGLKSQGILGQGMYKSTDGGNTFTVISSTEPSPANGASAAWSSIGKIACDPVDANRIYASTNRGFMISSDAGATWTEEGIQGSATSRDVEVASDGTVYLNYSSRVFVSESGDPGSFGSNLSGSVDIPTASSGRINIAVAPSDPNTAYVVTASGGNESSHTGIWVTYDKGANWEQISGASTLGFNYLNGQGDYNNALAVHPTNKDKIILGGVQLWQWEKGGNFERIGSEARYPGNTLYVHADKHSIVFHPTNPDIYYIGSDGGVGYTSDGGMSFSTRNKGYNVTQFYTLDMTAEGHAIGGTQDNSCPFLDGSGNTPRAARIVNSGDGAAVAASKYNSDNLIYSSQYGVTLRSSNGGNSGSTVWPQTMTNEDLGHDDYISTAPGESGFASFIAAYALWEDPNDADNYFTLGSVSNGIWMSRNIWDFANDPIGYRVATNGRAQTITVSADGDVAYIGYRGSLIQLTGLNGATDSLSSHYLSDSSSVIKRTIWSGSRLVTDVAINPEDAGEIVITLGQYSGTTNVFYSNNALDAVPTITAAQGNLPDMPVYSATFVAGEPGAVLVGTEFGVFGTENINGPTTSWAIENTGLDRVPVFALKQQGLTVGDSTNTTRGEIYAATHGRGMFKTRAFVGVNEIANNGNEADINTLSFSPNPASTSVVISADLVEASTITIEVYDLSGKVVKQLNAGNFAAGVQKITLNVSDLNEGVYLTRMIAGNKMSSGKLVIANH
ncbi:MAG: photosystem II stability/assembly factor-like uncharacterized protein [Candidatus Azotimanducaceae bacterium]|jgi:photosystem II stability/assembly factor-like uncharacterized protein